MPESNETIIAIGIMASIVYATRAGGYFIGLQLRHIPGLQPILETLPGCAMMAILVPVVRRGDLVDLSALICVLVLMWFTRNVVIATITGLLVLFLGAHWADLATRLPSVF